MNTAADGSILATMPPESAIEESVVTIGQPGAELIGVLARPADAIRTKRVGVVIVVGGPQTRAGSHRQFVIMARALAAAGHACLRFDYTGMGDSPGPKPDFEKAGPDIGRACDALLAAVPACDRIALWGLCDGATAAILYAQSDQRIAGVVAANPWARSESTRAAAIVTEHYGSRLRSPDFWKKLISGRVNVLAAAKEAFGNIRKALAARGAGRKRGTLIDRVVAALLARTPVLLMLSERDLTAAEFELALNAADRSMQRPLRTIRYPGADHTFSSMADWAAAIAATRDQLDAFSDD